MKAGRPLEPFGVRSFRAPVDVFLPFNPSISADDKEIAKGRFVRCVNRTCIASFAFDKAALDAFNAAKSGALVYKLGSRKLRKATSSTSKAASRRHISRLQKPNQSEKTSNESLLHGCSHREGT